MGPTLAGFIQFIQNVMGIDAEVLPTDSPVIPFALSVALAIVNQALCVAPIPSSDAAGVALNAGGMTMYNLAVYNLAGSNLLSYAQDLAGAPVVKGSGDPGLPFFQWTRKQYNINGFVSGVISGSSDETTSQTLVVQEAAKNFTLANLQALKDPFGRQYLAIAQSFGPTTFGMS
jgi:hypothetical protein